MKDPVSGQGIARTVRYVNNGYRLFFNSQHVMVQLNRGQRAWFDFLCEHMDLYNRVVVNSELKKIFGRFIQSVTSGTVSYSESSVSTYTKKLVELGLLLKTKTSNSYVVNPKYIFRGTESERMEYLTNLITDRVKYRLPIDKIIDVDIDTFFNRKTT